MGSEMCIRDSTSHLSNKATISDLRVWSLTEKQTVATIRAALGPDVDANTVRDTIRARLEQQFGISHVTVELH